MVSVEKMAKLFQSDRMEAVASLALSLGLPTLVSAVSRILCRPQETAPKKPSPTSSPGLPHRRPSSPSPPPSPPVSPPSLKRPASPQQGMPSQVAINSIFILNWGKWQSLQSLQRPRMTPNPMLQSILPQVRWKNNIG